LTSATSLGSSKIPHGTWQWPPRRRNTKCRVDSCGFDKLQETLTFRIYI
jgi:hypothetical protein